jgi:preprotein translocase SecE subunit
MFARLKQFLREVRLEFDKISWPSRGETIVLTTLVILMVIVLTGIVLFYDYSFVQIIDYVTRTLKF